jgi:hypothetical protein
MQRLLRTHERAGLVTTSVHRLKVIRIQVQLTSYGEDEGAANPRARFRGNHLVRQQLVRAWLGPLLPPAATATPHRREYEDTLPFKPSSINTPTRTQEAILNLNLNIRTGTSRRCRNRVPSLQTHITRSLEPFQRVGACIRRKRGRITPLNQHQYHLLSLVWKRVLPNQKNEGIWCRRLLFRSGL